ncbi:MAG: T9SS type A sorting domain-containing protein [Bacteroidetes bacterium]|nr:T9SS type A sorting domain-containing protein [Bacteroidota bacterium]
MNETACTTFTLNGQTYTASGTYTQTLVNAANCDSVITLNLTIDSVDASVTQAAALLTANATLASYQWLACNPFQAITGETNQNFVATANGDYAVAVTQNGCTDTSACYTVNGVGTQDFSVTNSIHLFPNPVKQNLLIQSQYPLQDANIKILSITGQVAREYNHISTDKFTIDMSSFVSGNYFIEIADKKNKYVRKVFKE